MLIMTDNTGVTIKRRIQDVNHVRIGVTQTAIWVDGSIGPDMTDSAVTPLKRVA